MTDEAFPGIISPATFAAHASGHRWLLAEHLQLLDDALIAASLGDARLVVEMPPRHGKSELVSRYAPAWYVGNYPDRRVILASYSDEFAATWGGRARDALERTSGWFGVAIRDDSSARNRWDVAGRDGGMISAGVGGGITGRGGDLIIVDDPVKDREAALSQHQRDATWEWFLSTLYTRLEPRGSIIVVQTRWHEDDLAGRLLAGETDEAWTELRLPAVAEKGDPLGREPGAALWPNRWPRGELDRIRGAIGSYWWSALYQQRPSPREGGMFRRSMFRIVPDAPDPIAVSVRVWDLAATAGGGDYLVGARWHRLSSGALYLSDVYRGQPGETRVEQTILQHAEADGRATRILVEREPSAAAKVWADHLARQLVGYVFRSEPVPRVGKAERAEPAAAAAENGLVYVRQAEWTAAWLREHEEFPNGAHDDQVDTTSGAVLYLAQAGRTSRPTRPRAVVPASLADRSR